MHIDKNILYSQNTDSVLTLYSKSKFGDPISINNISKNLSKFIKNNITAEELKKCVVYAANKSPLNEFCKKNSYIIAERVSKLLNLPLWSGVYVYAHSSATFYDVATDRHASIHKPKLLDKENMVPFQKNVLFIDDSILSGTTLQVSLDELQSMTDTVHAFFIVDLSLLKIPESNINNYAWKNKNIDSLVTLINAPEFIYTTQMVRAIDSLDLNDRCKLIERLKPEQVEVLKQAYFIYFGENLQF